MCASISVSAIPLGQASASNGSSQLPLGLHIPAAPQKLAPAPQIMAPAPQKLAPAPLHLPPDTTPLNLSVAGPSPACAPKWASVSDPQHMPKNSKPWTHNATLLLISLAKQMAEDFQSPVLKKVEVWKKVATQMQAKGYDFGAEECDIKFRQLKHRYKTIVDSKKKTGSGASSWVFFSSMEDLLADDPSVEPVLVMSSFAEASSGSSNSQSSNSQPKASADCSKRRKRKSEAPEWFEQYVSEQRRQMSEVISLQKQAVEVASERNNILKDFVSALTKK
ncbi:uncharacterized protein LOC127625031 [Xyrauchen texanus]|uniref:uncharacterized protein LOC127625031 n=1 Tax=Xyrauchen texanus TaxID=154827 RepID=UPI002242A015|nr:uncharacterized protein LOC127625031 [Xyrauchen texanus]